MGRWEPDARGRMILAALELFRDRGYDETTVADIAGAAGVTERTFFRHFADKREVLFDGEDRLHDSFLAAVDDAPAGVGTAELLDRVAAAAAAYFPEERRPFATTRSGIIASHSSLQERESLKLTTLATDLGAALRDRGMPEPAASLLGQSAVAAFHVTFATWVSPGEERSFAEISPVVLAELRALTR
jgi:AcrR family transcriptional regulator